MRMKTKDAAGRSSEQEMYDVDLDRLACVVTLGQIERVADRTTGEAINAEDGTALYQVQAGVPGCKLAGGSTGLAEVRLRIESHSEPRFDPYTALSLHGPVRLRGATVGERQDRQGFLSLRCRGVAPYQGAPNETAESDVQVPGVPVSLGDQGGLVVLAASEPRSVYNGQPVEVMGQRQMRLQISKMGTFTRRDGDGEFSRHESVTVDVPKSVWERSPIPFLGRVELLDLRCDARVNDNGRVNMVLAAAAYRVVGPTSPFNTPAPAPHRRGRNEPTGETVSAETTEG